MTDTAFVCRHADPRCEDDPCPWGIARTLCNAPADHPTRTAPPADEPNTPAQAGDKG